MCNGWWFDVVCLDDQWYFEAGILNNSMTTVGYVEFIYPGVNGLISDISSVGAVARMAISLRLGIYSAHLPMRIAHLH